jgi:hypothetical protein
MAKYAFFSRGAQWPEDDSAVQEFRGRLGAWFASLGEHLVDSGGPLRAVASVGSVGAVKPASGTALDGWGILAADDEDAAAELLRLSPLVTTYGATMDIYEMLPGVKDHGSS